MTKDSSEAGKRSNGISAGDMMFQIITKNTEVMTALCETLKDMEETMDEITKSDIKSGYARMDILNNVKINKKMNIIILLICVSIMSALALGGQVGWLIEVLTKIVSYF